MSILTKLALADRCIGWKGMLPEPMVMRCASAPMMVERVVRDSGYGMTAESIAFATGLNTVSVDYALKVLTDDGVIRDAAAPSGVYVLTDSAAGAEPDRLDRVRWCISGRYITRAAVAEELGISERDVERAVYELRCNGVNIVRADADGFAIYSEMVRWPGHHPSSGAGISGCAPGAGTSGHRPRTPQGRTAASCAPCAGGSRGGTSDDMEHGRRQGGRGRSCPDRRSGRRQDLPLEHVRDTRRPQPERMAPLRVQGARGHRQ